MDPMKEFVSLFPELEMLCVKMEELKTPSEIPPIPSLKALDINGVLGLFTEKHTELELICPSLIGMTNLQVLSLNRMEMEMKQPNDSSTQSSLPRVKEMQLRYCKFPQKSLAQWTKMSDCLTHLNIDMDISVTTPGLIYDFLSLFSNTLTTLKIHANRIPEEHGSRYLPALPELRYLDVNNKLPGFPEVAPFLDESLKLEALILGEQTSFQTFNNTDWFPKAYPFSLGELGIQAPYTFDSRGLLRIFSKSSRSLRRLEITDLDAGTPDTFGSSLDAGEVNFLIPLLDRFGPNLVSLHLGFLELEWIDVFDNGIDFGQLLILKLELYEFDFLEVDWDLLPPSLKALQIMMDPEKVADVAFFQISFSEIADQLSKPSWLPALRVLFLTPSRKDLDLSEIDWFGGLQKEINRRGIDYSSRVDSGRFEKITDEILKINGFKFGT